MTLILKSDKAAKSSIGNIFGVNGALDYQVLLDFNRGIYRYNNSGAMTDIALLDAISLTRTTKAEYKDRTGVTKTANANEPRLHYMSDLDVMGLLIEPPRTNLLLNPNAPVTQTVSIPNTGTVQALALRVEGTGSATMSGDITSLTSASATEGNPQGALPISGPSTINVTVTVTGNVTRFQLERTTTTQGGNFSSTFVPPDVATRTADKVTLGSLLTPKLLTAKTIVAQFVYQKRLVKGFQATIGVMSLEDSTKAKGGVYVTRGLSSGSGDATQTTAVVNPSTTAVAVTNGIPSTDARKVTTAITMDGGGLNIMQAVNGMFKSLGNTATTAIDFNKMTLGGNDGLYSSTGEAGGVLTHLVIYDRKLTDSELAKIATSWL